VRLCLKKPNQEGRARWQITKTYCSECVKRVRVTKMRVYSEGRNSIRNHERSGRTVEQHEENEATEISKQF
jgi:hypothetical protein